MPKKKTGIPTTLAQALAQNIQSDAQQAAALRGIQTELIVSVGDALDTLTNLLHDKSASPGTRLGAAQTLVKAYSSIQKATDTAEKKAETVRWSL